jgi:hypothetical protein
MLFQSGHWFLSVAVLACFVFPPRAASQGAIPQKNEATPPAQQPPQVVLLTPLLRFEDTGSGVTWSLKITNTKRETVLPKLAERAVEFESRLLSAAKDALGSKSTIVLPESLSQLGTEASVRLSEVSSRLARGNVTDESKRDLNLLSTPGERQLVLAHSFRIQVGPRASTAVIKTDVAFESTLVQAALVCSETGKVVWKNEQFIRKALKPDSSEFSKMLTHLYDGLEIKPGDVQCE